MKFKVSDDINNDVYFGSSKPRNTIFDVHFKVLLADDEGNPYVSDMNSTVACKDYCNDTLANYIIGYKNNDRAFAMWAEGTTLPKEGSYLLIRSTSCDRIEKGIKKYINPVEIKAGLQPTQVFHTDHTHCIVLKGDPCIFKDLHLANMWIMICRVMWHLEDFKYKRSLESVLEYCSTRNYKDSKYLLCIIHSSSSNFVYKLFSIHKEWVVDSKKYREMLIQVSNVHISGGIRELFRYKTLRSSTCCVQAMDILVKPRIELLVRTFKEK